MQRGRAGRRAVALCAAITLRAATAGAAHSGTVTAGPGPVTLRAGLKITRNATARPGVYRLRDAGEGMVQISGRSFTVDLHGAKIVGPGTGQGVGLHITDAHNVIIADTANNVIRQVMSRH